MLKYLPGYYSQKRYKLLLLFQPGILFRIQIEEPKKIEDFRKPKEQKLAFSGAGGPEKPKTKQRKSKKVGRNAPCPCGSGKKYKKCCGQ